MKSARLNTMIGQTAILVAWVLWAHETTLPPSGRESWRRVNAHATKIQCEDSTVAALTEIVRSNPDPNVKRVGNSLWFTKTSPVTIVSFDCWPDTVDPRQ
jgi:hypothetical protein